jgi:hypothetical protein
VPRGFAHAAHEEELRTQREDSAGTEHEEACLDSEGARVVGTESDWSQPYVPWGLRPEAACDTPPPQVMGELVV